MIKVQCPKCKHRFQVSREIEKQIISSSSGRNNTTELMLEKQIRDLKNQIDILQRKAAQGSQQLQGEVKEIELAGVLRIAFPRDEIRDVGLGKRGADLKHYVRQNQEDEGTLIVWECKNAARWSNGWLEKLRVDKRAAGAALAVLVSDVLPRTIENFGELDGIYVCRPVHVKQFAGIIRNIVLAEVRSTKTLEGRSSKAERLYDYFNSRHFSSKVQTISEVFMQMKGAILRQKGSMTMLWAEQEKQIELITLEFASMNGQLSALTRDESNTPICESELLRILASVSSEPLPSAPTPLL